MWFVCLYYSANTRILTYDVKPAIACYWKHIFSSYHGLIYYKRWLLDTVYLIQKDYDLINELKKFSFTVWTKHPYLFIAHYFMYCTHSMLIIFYVGHSRPLNYFQFLILFNAKYDNLWKTSIIFKLCSKLNIQFEKSIKYTSMFMTYSI